MFSKLGTMTKGCRALLTGTAGMTIAGGLGGLEENGAVAVA